jgi:hypothetical protein
LALPAEHRQILEWVVTAPHVPARMAKRARILLLAADGQSNRQIAEAVGVAVNTVKLWRSRYLDDGGALNQRDKSRSGRPRAVDRLGVIATMLTPPPAEAKAREWSARGLATACGVSTYTVSRVWREYAMEPARPGRVIVVAEPEFHGGWLTIVGSYLDPPHSAVALVLVDDEDSGDLHRWCGVHGPDPLVGRGGDRSEAFLAFCELVHGAHPAGIVRIVVNGGERCASQRTAAWLRSHPRIRLHCAPSLVTWVNLMEVFIYLDQLVKRSAGAIVGTSQPLDSTFASPSRDATKRWMVALRAAIGPGTPVRMPFTWVDGVDAPPGTTG